MITGKEKITVIRTLNSGDEVRYVEYRDIATSRNVIMNFARFESLFGPLSDQDVKIERSLNGKSSKATDHRIREFGKDDLNINHT